MSARSLNINGPRRQGNIEISTHINYKTGAIDYRFVYLHGNGIADINYSTRQVTISSCGWNTTTTKTAINNVLKQLNVDARVWQKDYVWYLNKRADTILNETVVYENIEFKDGMILNF